MIFWLICAFSAGIEASRILDRIVAIVEDDVILQSDIDLIGMGSDTDALNGLIEQKLLLKLKLRFMKQQEIELEKKGIMDMPLMLYNKQPKEEALLLKIKLMI